MMTRNVGARLPDRKMTGEWLAHCGACPVPEIANVFNRARIPFHQITGMLDDDPECWREVARSEDDRRMAGSLRRLPRAGDRQRLQPCPHPVSPDHRHVG